MITHLNGKLVEKNPTHLIIDCHGVGYEVHISLYTFGQIPDQENVRVYTHLQIREDAHQIFGFYTPQERALFRLLIGVSGIGASTARSMLSSMEPLQIQQAVLQEDINTIKSIKGIGLKTAQRLILELKDKIQQSDIAAEIPAVLGNTTKEEALSALEVLGYARKASEKIVDQLIQAAPESSVEQLIKGALNKL
ncbi:MAG: Holliday junction branch migration protein RuvA [Flavobacteriaceae bacterium]